MLKDPFCDGKEQGPDPKKEKGGMYEGPDRVAPKEKAAKGYIHIQDLKERADESMRGTKAGRAGDADEHEAEGPTAKRKKITGKTTPGRQADGASTTGGQRQQMDEE